MAYKIKNPKNVTAAVNALRSAEMDLQNAKASSQDVLTSYNIDRAIENISTLHKCLNQVQKDLGVNVDDDLNVVAAWPGGK